MKKPDNIFKNVFEVKTENIIIMAINFTSMVRVFNKNSKKQIIELLRNYFFEKISKLNTKSDFDEMHSDFCKDFINKIKTASRNNKTKESNSASYGQAAKVFDVAIKVFVYYCKMPDAKVARKIQPFLNAAIDTPILKHLKNKYPDSKTKAKSLQKIDAEQYINLQKIVKQDIKNNFDDKINPVQYDDIMWNLLNSVAAPVTPRFSFPGNGKGSSRI